MISSSMLLNNDGIDTRNQDNTTTITTGSNNTKTTNDLCVVKIPNRDDTESNDDNNNKENDDDDDDDDDSNNNDIEQSLDPNVGVETEKSCPNYNIVQQNNENCINQNSFQQSIRQGMVSSSNIVRDSIGTILSTSKTASQSIVKSSIIAGTTLAKTSKMASTSILQTANDTSIETFRRAQSVGNHVLYSAGSVVPLLRNKTEGKATDAGFVVFTSLYATQTVLQMIHHPKPYVNVLCFVCPYCHVIIISPVNHLQFQTLPSLRNKVCNECYPRWT
jgi:hypothetical protein